MAYRIELADDADEHLAGLSAGERSRVYYDVSEDPAPVVTVRAIGVKVRSRVRIGDEWWEPRLKQPEKGP